MSDQNQARIEAIDAALVALIDERAALASSQTPSDAVMTLRRVAAVPRKHARLGLMVRLWREILAEDRARLSPSHLAIWSGKDGPRTLELARQTFGAAPPLQLVTKAEEALAIAKAPGGIAVLSVSGDHPWWLRLLAEPSVQVFAALPDLASGGPMAALAVAALAPEPTGADQTFWITDAPGPADAIIEALAKDGVAADLVSESGGLRLFGLAGFYQRDDLRLSRAPGHLCGVIGASPEPFYV